MKLLSCHHGIEVNEIEDFDMKHLMAALPSAEQPGHYIVFYKSSINAGFAYTGFSSLIRRC